MHLGTFSPEEISYISSLIYIRVHLMCPLFLSQSSRPWNLSTVLEKICNIMILITILYRDRCSMRVWGRTNGRIYGKAFKRSSNFIRNWRTAQCLSLYHKFKTFTRHVLTFVRPGGAELENEITFVVNC